MANTQAQFGFKHIGFISGSAPDYALNSNYAIQSTYGTPILQGTPMIKSGAYIIPATGTGNLTTMVGIFQGVDFVPVGGVPGFNSSWPGTSAVDGKAHIVDAPGALFLAASLLTPIPATAIGANIGFSTGAGGTTTGAGFATYVLDTSTITTGPSGAFQVYSLYNSIGNGSDTTTSYSWAVVTFNNQRFKNLTAPS